MALTYEQTAKIADWFLHRLPHEQEAILASFTEDEKTVFMDYLKWYTLFAVPEHYYAVKQYAGKELYKVLSGVPVA